MNAKRGLSMKLESRLTPLVNTIAKTAAQLRQHQRMLRALHMQYDTMRYLAELIVSINPPSIRNLGQVKTVADRKASSTH